MRYLKLARLLVGILSSGLLGMTQCDAQSEATLYQRAKAEPSITWYNGITSQEFALKIAAEFQKKYPGLRVNPVSVGAQVVFQRILQEIDARNSQTDVYSTADITQMGVLKSKGALLNYRPENAKYLRSEVSNIDSDNAFVATNFILIGMAINKRLVGVSDMPKNWPDLLNEKWKGQIAVGSPNFSGSVGVWMVAMEQKYGWRFFEKLNELDPLVGRSISDPLTVLNAGERKVAASAAPDVTMAQASKGNPLAVAYPRDGMVAAVCPTAIIRTSKSPDTAKLFENFLLSKEAAEINWASYSLSVRGDLKTPTNVPGGDDEKLIIPSAGQILAKLLPLRRQWRDTFGGM